MRESIGIDRTYLLYLVYNQLIIDKMEKNTRINRQGEKRSERREKMRVDLDLALIVINLVNEKELEKEYDPDELSREYVFEQLEERLFTDLYNDLRDAVEGDNRETVRELVENYQYHGEDPTEEALMEFLTSKWRGTTFNLPEELLRFIRSTSDVYEDLPHSNINPIYMDIAQSIYKSLLLNPLPTKE